jgi:hypothetical protein
MVVSFPSSEKFLPVLQLLRACIMPRQIRVFLSVQEFLTEGHEDRKAVRHGGQPTASYRSVGNGPLPSVANIRARKQQSDCLLCKALFSSRTLRPFVQSGREADRRIDSMISMMRTGSGSPCVIQRHQERAEFDRALARRFEDACCQWPLATAPCCRIFRQPNSLTCFRQETKPQIRGDFAGCF